MPFLDENPGSGFLGPGVEPDAQRLKEVIFAPGSTYVPQPHESAKIYETEQAKPITQKVGEGVGAFFGAIPEIVGHVGKNLGEGAWQAYDAYANQGRAATEAGAGLALTGVEGLTRGGLDLGEVFTRGAVRSMDYLSKGDPAAQYHARLVRNLEWDRMRQQMAEGKQGGWLDPLKTLQDNGMMYPGLAEATSYVADPSVLVPGGMLAKVGIKGATGAATKAAESAIKRATGEGLVSSAARGVENVAGNVADAALAPGQKIKEVVDNALPGTGAGTTAAATPTAVGAAVAVPMRGVERGAQVVEQLGRTSGDSSIGRLGQVAMSEAAPAWVRGAARQFERIGVDKAASYLGDVAKSGATGAAVGTAISYPGAESAEEVGMAAGGGFALGSMTHIAMTPAIHGRQYRMAQDADILRWYQSKSPEEQAAIGAMNLSRDEGLKLAVNEVIANGLLDPNANVRFVYQDPQTFEATYGSQRGVALVQGDKPTIIFNTGKMKTGTAYHELFHTLSRSPDVVDYGALTTKLLGVNDEAGNVVKPGLLSTTDFAKIGDQYFSRLDPVGQKSVLEEKNAFDANPNSPEAAPWKKRIVNEVGAELFANLSRDTAGSLLDAVDKPTLMLVDSMTRGDRSQWVQNWGAKLQKVLGAAPTVESDIFPGLKSSPEIQAMMRDFVRAKRNLTKTPEFGDEHADPTVVVNPRDALRTGGDEIVKKFPDNDNFAKDAAGNPQYSGGRPVLLTEGEIKKVQTNRAKALDAAVKSVPDSGEAGVLRDNGSGGLTGRWFSDAQMQKVQTITDNVLTPSMKAKIKTLNDLVRKGDGSPILLFYNAALKSRRYSSAIRETARVLTPISMSITKAGNFIVTGLDITAFNSKLNRWMTDRPKAFEDFGSADVFVQKAQQYLDNHQKGQPGATGLDADAAKAQRMAYRINDFINIQDIASAARNPDRLSKTSDKDSLVRSFRFDRMNRIEEASGDKFPINYELQKQVFSPQGEKEANREIFTARQQTPENAPDLPPTARSQKLTEASDRLNKESGQYSQLERTIDAKVQGKEIPAAQLAAMLRNPQSGVKAEELRWSGIDQFLQGKGKVTKQEVLDFVRANRLQIEENRLGEDSFRKKVWADFNWRDKPLPNGGKLHRLMDHGTEIATIYQRPAQEPGAFTFETDFGGKITRDFNSLYEAQLDLKAQVEPTLGEDRTQVIAAKATKYDQYKSPGGENYREILFRFPDTSQVKDGPTDHWQDARVFGHARVQDFDGGKTLLVDEFQSDWHQKGRKEGYKGTDVSPEKKLWEDQAATAHRMEGEFLQTLTDLTEQHRTLEQKLIQEVAEKWGKAGGGFIEPRDFKTLAITRELNHVYENPELKELSLEKYRVHEKLRQVREQREGLLRRIATQDSGKVNEAPFRNTVHEFMFKRVLRDAVEKGYDAVEWPDGGTIAKRFNLSQHMQELHYVADVSKSEAGWTIYPDGDEGNAMFIPDAALADHVGHGVAERMRKGEGHPRQLGDENVKVLSGETQLDSGEAQGKKEFYDQILPSFVNKYTKKWGGAVKDSAREGNPGPGTKLDLAHIDSELKRVEAEMEAASQRPMSAALRMNRLQNEHRALVEQRQKLLQKDGFPVHRLEITPQMREDIKTKGQPLFSPDAPPSPNKKQPGSPEFEEWFLGSKVTDDAGAPLQVYHGTAPTGWEWKDGGVQFRGESFDKFKTPAYFAENKKYAAGFAAAQASERALGNKPRVIAAHLNLKNPFVTGDRAYWSKFRKQPEAEMARLESAGFDGVVMREVEASKPELDGKVFIAFKPEQINFSPDAPAETTPIGVKQEKEVVDNLPPADSISRMITAAFSPDEVQHKRVRPLPHAVGEEDVPVVHFSSQPGLKKLDPAYMGKGMANSRDRRGGPKSFFFVAESPLGADEQFFGQGGKVAYGAVVSGTRLYDLRLGKPDPLGYNNALNPAAAEETLASKGYAGVLVEGGKGDPRKTVTLFKRTAVKEIPVKGPLKKAPRVEFSPDVKATPSEEIRTQAREYNKSAKLDTTPHQTAVPVREDLAKRLADAFESAKHDPENPEVKKAYSSLATETKAQWDFVTGKGVKMEPWTKDGQPYKNSAEMVADVRDNKHLWFFPTDQGFGSGDKATTHPMLSPSGVKVGGKELVANDLFRAVHDYFGHAKEGFEFGPKGEYNAYLAHNQMFSKEAQPALASETLAQNSWVNYGKHLRRTDGTIPAKGDKDFVPATERPYADQKAALIPSELVSEALGLKKNVDKSAPLMSPDNVKRPAPDLLSEKPDGVVLTPNDKLIVKAARQNLRDRIQLLPDTEAKVQVRRAIQDGVPEVIQYQKKAKEQGFASGSDWYREDVVKMENTTKKIFPEASTPERMVLFKAVLASLSGNVAPKQNYRFAAEAFAEYLKTGKFPLRSPRKKDTGENFQFGILGDTQMGKLQKIAEHFKGDEKSIASYLLNIQPRLLLRDKPKRIAENNFGAFDLGDKFGPFFLNLNGISHLATVDIWANRTWNRWMGTPLRKTSEGYEVPSAPTDVERARIQQSFERIAEEASKVLGEPISVMDAQAVLWFYEKDLMAKLGAQAVSRGTFSSAAEDYAKAPVHAMPQQGLLDILTTK